MKCFCVILVDSKTDVKTAWKRLINVVGIPQRKLTFSLFPYPLFNKNGLNE